MKINQYEWDTEADLIAEGAFAEVFKARDTNTTGRYVALKVYKEAVAKGTSGSSAQKKYTLEKEFGQIDGLSHTNIVSYYGISYIHHTDALGRDSSYPVIIMEYAPEGTLLDFQKSKPSPKEVELVIEGILDGVRYLHKEGVLHRDLKPGNILITRNRRGEPVPKITDFGISRDLLSEQTIEESLTAGVGTPHYMAPEQFYKKKFGLNQEISERTDYWAVGVIVCRLLTGKLPFGHGSKEYEFIREAITSSTPDLSKVPDKYHGLVQNCLQKHAEQRSFEFEAIVSQTSNEKEVSEVSSVEEPLAALEEEEELTVTEVEADGGIKEEPEFDSKKKPRILIGDFSRFQQVIITLFLLANLVLGIAIIYFGLTDRDRFPFLALFYVVATMVILVRVFRRQELNRPLEVMSFAFLLFYGLSTGFLFTHLLIKYNGDANLFLGLLFAAVIDLIAVVWLYLRLFPFHFKTLNGSVKAVIILSLFVYLVSWVVPATYDDPAMELMEDILYNRVALDVIALPNVLFFYALLLFMSKTNLITMRKLNTSVAALGIVLLTLLWYALSEANHYNWIEDLYVYMDWYKFSTGNDDGLGVGFYAWSLSLSLVLFSLIGQSYRKDSGISNRLN